MRTEEEKRGKESILPILIYILYSPDQFLPFEKIQVDGANWGNERGFAIAGVRFRWHRNFRVRGDWG